MEKKAITLRVSGHVQGVGFRAYVKARADELGITGWVRNLPDGSVLIFSTLNEDTTDLWIATVTKGPPFSRVDGVERGVATAVEVGESRGFSIMRADD